MDFYSALGRIVEQIPPGRVAFLADVAAALGDKAAAVTLPRALAKIGDRTPAVARVVKSDGSILLAESRQVFEKDEIRIAGSKVLDPHNISFNDFKTSYPLRRLRTLQKGCAKRVVLKDGVRRLSTIAGLDVSYDDDHAVAVAVLLDAVSLERIDVAVAKMDVRFPYVPGYLAFRELPPLMEALKVLSAKPSLLMVDGHGILHPARCGIAAQIGVTANIPTIGVAKSRLVGEMRQSRMRMGEGIPVWLDGKIMGYALRTSRSEHPIYISPGNLVTPRTALRMTKEACLHRIPEPIRQAHVIATEKRKIKNGL